MAARKRGANIRAAIATANAAANGAEAGSRRLFFSRTHDFLDSYLPNQVGRSRHTIESYRDSLSVFRRFALEERGLSIATMTFADCNRDLVLSFLEHLRSKGCSAGTCNQRLAAIRAYLWYAADQDVAVQSVWLSVYGIPPVKGPEREKAIIGEEALAAILAHPDPSTRTGLRDRAMLALLYDAAIRLAELIGLDVGDASLGADPYVRVTGKGSKERSVSIRPETARLLQAHVLRSHGADPDPTSPIFFTTYGGKMRRMSESNVQRIVTLHADGARETCPEVPDPVHPHMFRRTRATGLYREGVPIEVVATILGHASAETTKVYATPSPEMLRDRMDSSIPVPEGETPAWANASEDELARLHGLR